MGRYEEKKIELGAKDDARRDKGAGIIDLMTFGLISSSSYNPPSDPEERAIYDHAWDQAKKER